MYEYVCLGACITHNIKVYIPTASSRNGNVWKRNNGVNVNQKSIVKCYLANHDNNHTKRIKQ